MNSRGCNVSEDPQTICPSSSQLSAIDDLLLKLPIDLIVEIFSRLPLKSISRCRCVSKRWASFLRRSDFTELFLTKSLSHPKLLFACRTQRELLFFSSPQLQHPDENLSTITADHQVSFPFESVYDISSPVNGFVCIRDDLMLKDRKTQELVSVIWYDPIEKQHKVLAMIKRYDTVVYHQVLTLRGSGNLTWRKAECGIPHFPPNPDSVCIGGVLYYAARASAGGYMIVCFDLRSEKYSFVKFTEREKYFATLINFQGKLASLMAHPNPLFISGTSTSFEMWILRDPEKHGWYPRIFKLPPTWKDVVGGEELLFRGVTATNEFVLSCNCKSSSEPFHVYYYNFINEAITRVEIQGMGAFERGSIVGIFPNHGADVKLV
ncbi:hypothetical protein DY000_02029932 [Brassica cretica]|uniref:F-box domain-containing protein n=1 Tax=Brassica cretica TaxID=69181 RepID=A0ABQ7DKA4_BRACR|nr:hypothetical protein DY000_02029932 [Brassica cretica]